METDVKKPSPESEELLPPPYSAPNNGDANHLPPVKVEPNAPVKVEPSWESTNKELEFTGADGQELNAPVDRFNLVYIILIMHGIATLMPWNMFITANSYFTDYKLGNRTGVDAGPYRDYFLSFLGFTAQIPNVILNALNLFCQCGGGNITRRIVWSIIIVVVMFIATVALAMLDSSNWPGTFFWITMATVVVINMANGVYQNSVYGVAACLPMKYTNAVVLGSANWVADPFPPKFYSLIQNKIGDVLNFVVREQTLLLENISGTLTAVLMIVSIASTPDPRTSAIYYFIAAIFVLLVAFDTYFALPLIPFYRYYRNRADKRKQVAAHANTPPPFGYIFRKCWVQDLSVFFVFFVTLTCFPAIQAGIGRVSDSFFLNDKYFTPVTCFLFFNAFAMLGNVFSEFVRKPGPRWVWLPIVLRGLFIPFFMFCNFKPDKRNVPVLIANDYAYCVGGIVMAFTSGYFSSLAMMYAPRNVEPEHQGTAGMMAAFFLISGIFLGVCFSLPMTMVITEL